MSDYNRILIECGLGHLVKTEEERKEIDRRDNGDLRKAYKEESKKENKRS